MGNELSIIAGRIDAIEERQAKQVVRLQLQDGATVETTQAVLHDAMFRALFHEQHRMQPVCSKDVESPPLEEIFADPEETELLLNAVSDDSGSGLIELFKMVMT